jgi:hypothetical protein
MLEVAIMDLRNVKFGLSDNDLVSVLNTYNFKIWGFIIVQVLVLVHSMWERGVTKQEEENVKKNDMVKA